MKRMNFNIKDRKVLTLGLCLVAVCVFTLTIAYAALNAVLTIQGSAQVSSADWDVHLANPIVKNGSTTTDVPVITSGKSLTFNTTLNMPGDFYEFTVDVVNSGSIDAMIEKVTKTPELTVDQAKFLKYEVSYANGESIANKQAIAAGVTMPIKVRVEYRNDLVASDLPTGQVQLTLGLVLDYIQGDGTGTTVKDNGVYNPVSADGDINEIGTIVTIGSEKFYTIGTEGDNVKLLSMYNLYVGGVFDGSKWTAYGDEATGKQDSTMLGLVLEQSIGNGTIAFSSTNYWESIVNSYPAYVYDSNSTLYPYIENYKKVLETIGITPNEARLISYEELVTLGCDLEQEFSCKKAPDWVYATTYWSGVTSSSNVIGFVGCDGSFISSSYFGYYRDDLCGIRPVIVISRSLI